MTLLKLRNSKNVRISSGERLDILKEAKQQNATKILNFSSYDLEVESANAILSLLVALSVKVEMMDLKSLNTALNAKYIPRRSNPQMVWH